MGEVWRARHRLLARPAAVKLIRPEVFEAAGAAKQSALRLRFEREAQTTALLQSPHTISLFDYGVTDDGAFYYVMELLDGFDLKTLVERFGPLPVERAVHVLCRRATPSPRRMRSASCIATSRRPTSSCAGTAATSTSSRSSTSAS